MSQNEHRGGAITSSKWPLRVGLSPSRVRRCMRAGLVQPTRVEGGRAATVISRGHETD